MELKRDKYRDARKGRSRLLSLYCRKCRRSIVRYQKDGAGPLLRLYFDRILYPEKLVGLQKKSIKNTHPLKCKCGELVGMPVVYNKEKRKSFRLYQDALKERTKKS